MKALDTNVLVRFLMRDDERQASRVLARIEQAEQAGEVLFITDLALLETIWVLSRLEALPRAAILEALERLLAMPVLRFERPERVRRLVDAGRTTLLDLADLFIGLAASDHGCEATLTFDKKASRSDLFEAL